LILSPTDHSLPDHIGRNGADYQHQYDNHPEANAGDMTPEDVFDRALQEFIDLGEKPDKYPYRKPDWHSDN
jgi:hypothetical protein